MHTELGIHIEATDTAQTEPVDAVMDAAATFEAQRTTPPQTAVPPGPSVLVDDFPRSQGSCRLRRSGGA